VANRMMDTILRRPVALTCHDLLAPRRFPTRRAVLPFGSVVGTGLADRYTHMADTVSAHQEFR